MNGQTTLKKQQIRERRGTYKKENNDMQMAANIQLMCFKGKCRNERIHN